METSETPLNKGSLDNEYDVDLDSLQTEVDMMVAAPGDSSLYNVDVSMDGEWCVLEGTVDSHGTKAALFSLVPSLEGRRCIVDRLQVTCE